MTHDNPARRRSTARASRRHFLAPALLGGLGIAFLTLAMLCLSLGACSRGVEPGVTPDVLPTARPTGGVPATAQPSPPAPTLQPTPAVVELKVWVPPEFALPEGQALSQAILDDFEAAHPNLRVRLSVKQAHGKGGLLDLLAGASQVAPDFAPDVVLVSGADLAEAAQANLVQPLDPLASPQWVEGLFQTLAPLGTSDGTRYGIPFGVDLVHLAYRATITATAPMTWGAVSESGGRYLFVPGRYDGYWGDSLLLQYLGAGGSLRDAQGQVSVDARLLAQVLALCKTLYDQGVLPEDILAVTTPDAAWALFTAGEVDFVEVRASEFLARQAPADTGFSAVPTLNGTPVATTHGWVWGIPARSPYRQQAAVQFLDWVLSPEREKMWCEAARCLPASRASWLGSGRLSPYESLLFSLLQVAVPFPPTLESAEAALALQDALTQVLTGEASPQQAAEKAANTLNRQ